MKRHTCLATMIVATALSAVLGPASAADEEVAKIVRIEGEVSVSRGAQYVDGTEGMALEIRTRVMALANSTIVIQFNDGCRYELEANEMLIIEEQSPCALGLVDGTQFSGTGAATNLGWVPPAAAAIVAITGAAFSTGSNGSGSSNATLRTISE